MTKKMKEIGKFIRDGLLEAQENLKELEAKKAKGTYSYWLEWNGMAYVHWEFAKECWEQLSKGFERIVAEGKTDEQLVQWVEGCRDYFVELVLKTSPPHSTNQLGNLIEMQKIEVWREFAADTLNSNSLKYLLLKLKGC